MRVTGVAPSAFVKASATALAMGSALLRSEANLKEAARDTKALARAAFGRGLYEGGWSGDSYVQAGWVWTTTLNLTLPAHGSSLVPWLCVANRPRSVTRTVLQHWKKRRMQPIL